MKNSSLFYIAVVILGLLTMMLSSCKWTPQRDNPKDPLSSFYVPPPITRAPEIDTLFMTTDCVFEPQTSFCAFEIVCLAFDVNEYVRYDSVVAHVDTIFLGDLEYDPSRRVFFLHLDEQSIPGNVIIDDLVGRPLIVNVYDISEEKVSSRSISFIAPLLDPRPMILGPKEYEWTTPHPRLHWNYWNGARPHTFSVELKRNDSVIWDSSGILSSDTTVIVTDSLHNSSDAHWLYSWRLTVITDQDNRITSAPAYFWVSNSMPFYRKDQYNRMPTN